MIDCPFDMQIRRGRKQPEMIFLRCEAILRTLPGRRCVYEGHWDGREVIVKIFTNRLRGRFHIKREVLGLRTLTERGIRTPSPLFTGKNSKQQLVLVTEKIPHTQDLISFFQQHRKGPERKEILCKWVQLIARMHEKGVLQKDLHAGNFLLADGMLYALDPAQMHFSSAAIARHSSFRQLASLLSNYSFGNSQDTMDLAKAYFQQRKWKWDSSVLPVLEKQIRIQRRRGLNKVLRKILRNCTYCIKIQTNTYTGIFQRTIFEGQNCISFMQNLDIQMEAGQILKTGNTCFVSRLRTGTHDLVIKRYNYKGFRHSLRHTLKGSRARKCWLFGHRLFYAGIAAARPLAFVEQRKHGLVRQSYIINEYVEGPDIQTYLQNPKTGRDEHDKIIRQAEHLLEDLADCGLTHGDMKPINILVQEGKPVLIDLDSVRRHRFSFVLKYYKRKMILSFHNRLQTELR